MGEACRISRHSSISMDSTAERLVGRMPLRTYSSPRCSPHSALHKYPVWDVARAGPRPDYRRAQKGLHRPRVTTTPRQTTQDAIKAVPRAERRRSTIGDEDGGWFFNLRVHSSPPGLLQEELPALHSPKRGAAKKQLPTKPKRTRPAIYLGGKLPAGVKALDPENGYAAIKGITMHSAVALRNVINTQSARSKGDSLIFHNLPVPCDKTLEGQVIDFCQNYFVDLGINELRFLDVRQMEQRFGKAGPVVARVSHVTHGHDLLAKKDNSGRLLDC